MQGTISANGGAGTGGSHGGGSGGSIWLRCRTISGAGTLSVDGGRAAQTISGGGGGGRMAIIATDTNAQAALSPYLSITSYANPADGQNGNVPQRGSLYLSLPSKSVLYIPFVSTNKPLRGKVYGLQTVTVSGDLSISNEWLELTEPGVNVSVASNVVVNTGSLRLGSSDSGNPFLLTCNNLWFTNGTTNSFYASIVTNVSGVTNHLNPVYGGRVEVKGALVVATNCLVLPYSHPTNGGSVMFVAGSAAIAGTVNADGLGFRGGPVNGDANGFGPGRGIANGSGWRFAGGGYGGKGHLFGGGTGGIVYGVSNAPVAPGSGGCGNLGQGAGGNGGGLIRFVVAGPMTVTGTLTANGDADAFGAPRSSAGSGGGIYLTCSRFVGPGTLTAKGGKGSTSEELSDGGGGRIAIQAYSINTNGCTISVIKGTAGGTGAENGTLSLVTLPPRGTIVMIE